MSGTIQTILKDSNHDLSLFSTEEVENLIILSKENKNKEIGVKLRIVVRL